MSLHPGRYVIGTDEESDIVLADSQMAPHHTFLTLSDGAVVIDGAAVEGRTALDIFKSVLLGGVALALGPTDASWPKIELPKFEPIAPADAGSDGDEAAEAASADSPSSGSEDKPAKPPHAGVGSTGTARGGLSGRAWIAVASAVLVPILAVTSLGF